MTWYKTGTVAVTPGSNAVIGTGTAFIANSRVGDGFRGPDGGWYEVTNIASDTALSIAPPYGDPSAYALAPLQGYVKESADALRAATQVIASGVTDMQEQVAAAAEAAESAVQSKTQASEQAGIATSAAEASSDNKDAAQLAAQQSQSSAQTSGAAAVRSETARDSILQSEQAAAASAVAAAESADRAEEVTEGKAASGNNNDITSLRALTADGFDRIRQGIAVAVGATSSAPGKKGLVPAAGIDDRNKFLKGDGTYGEGGAKWGGIAGLLADQTDLKAVLDSKGSIITKETVTAGQGWTNGGQVNFTHASGQPRSVMIELVFKQAVAGMAVGQIMVISCGAYYVNSTYYGCDLRKLTPTSAQIQIGAAGLYCYDAVGATFAVTPAMADLRLRVLG
ncbi:hypothetical protein ACW9I5_10520 [Pseudomonas azotoformans]